MYKKNFDFVVDKARAIEKPLRVVIAGADAENILLGAFRAEAAGFADPILVGDPDKITEMLKNLSLLSRDYKIVEERDQVFRTFLSPLAFISCTRLSSAG